MRPDGRLALSLAVALTLGGCNCGEDLERVDGGRVDGGSDPGAGDSGTPERDAGAVDAGGFDAGGFDAGGFDAGGFDAGGFDAGGFDAGGFDAGGFDAGRSDAGSSDAGSLDAGSDAGLDAGPTFDDAGCPVPTGTVLDAADAGLPTQGLRLWLRADLGVATLGAAGVSVCRWEDLSGNARHFTPAFAATPPTLAAAGLRGRPSVTFPTDSQALVRYDLLGIAPTAGRTVALIGINRDLTRRYQAFLQGQPNTPGTYLGLDTNTFQTAGAREGAYVTNNGYDVDLATSTSARTHLFSVSTMVPGTALPGALTYTVDGVERTLTRTPGGLGNGLIEDFSGATYTALGAGAAGFLGAELGDVLVWDRALTASERAQVEAYFSARYP